MYRSVDQLKIKYDNLKNKARKIVAHNKSYVKGTDDGSASSFKGVLQLILRIINKTTVADHASSFDCDVQSSNQEDLLTHVSK